MRYKSRYIYLRIVVRYVLLAVLHRENIILTYAFKSFPYTVPKFLY